MKNTHLIKLDDLQSATTYYFDRVCDGVADDNGGSHYRASTGPVLGVRGPDNAYG